jgi:type II secretory pathway pseudopilin PulG
MSYPELREPHTASGSESEHARHRQTTARGFTIVELLVSMSILMIISVSVVTDLNRTRYQEELQESARLLAGALRDLQTRAFAAGTVSTCIGAGNVKLVCEQTTVGCTNACSTRLPPYAFGMVLNGSATSVDEFAEVEPTYNDRRPTGVGGDEHEQIKNLEFLLNNTGSNYVTLPTQFITNVGAFSTIWVTFERQNGAMRINACNWPSPYTSGCGFFPESTTVTITLSHTKLPGVTKSILLNAITGRISLQ